MISFNFFFFCIDSEQEHSNRKLESSFLEKESFHFRIFLSVIIHHIRTQRTHAFVQEHCLNWFAKEKSLASRLFVDDNKRAVFINTLQFEGDRILTHIQFINYHCISIAFLFLREHIILFQIQKRCNAVAMLSIRCVPGFYPHIYALQCVSDNKEKMF